MQEGFDGSVLLDSNDRVVAEHPLLARPRDGETRFVAPVRLRRVRVAAREVDAVEEHWVDDGLRGHTLVFLAQDLDGVVSAAIEAAAAEHFGVDLAAVKGEPRAGGVSVNRRNPDFVFATAAYYAEYED